MEGNLKWSDAKEWDFDNFVRERDQAERERERRIKEEAEAAAIRAATKIEGCDIIRRRVRIVMSANKDEAREAGESETAAIVAAMIEAAREVIADTPDRDFYNFVADFCDEDESLSDIDVGKKIALAANSAAQASGLRLDIARIEREKIAADGAGFYFVCPVDTGANEDDFWPAHPRDVDSTYEQWEAGYAGCRTVDKAYARLAKLGNNDGITCAIRCICYHSNDIPADGGYPDTQYDDRTIEFYGGEVVRDDECPKCRKVVKWVDDGEWSWGGCGMRYHSHCKKCGLKRVVYQGGQHQNHWDIEYGDGDDEDGDDD